MFLALQTKNIMGDMCVFFLICDICTHPTLCPLQIFEYCSPNKQTALLRRQDQHNGSLAHHISTRCSCHLNQRITYILRSNLGSSVLDVYTGGPLYCSYWGLIHVSHAEWQWTYESAESASEAYKHTVTTFFSIALKAAACHCTNTTTPPPHTHTL